MASVGGGEKHTLPQVNLQGLDAVRRLMPGCNADAVQADWQAYWLRSGRPQLRAPDAAFVGFAKMMAQSSED